MRISEYYELGIQQPSLDFVDVRINSDTPLFLDPTALNLLDTEWGAYCRSLIQDYFHTVLYEVKNGNHNGARNLLSILSEPNETKLGYSTEFPRGHGMGVGLAEDMWQSLSESRAVETGIIQDLEDTALLIDGVGSDIISDITTNIIRKPLIDYTQSMCAEYGISTEEVASGQIWDSMNKSWSSYLVDLPVADGNTLLLVPKILVRKQITFSADNYYNVYLLTRIQEEEAARGFVRILKSGEARPPTKKQLKKKYSAGKQGNRLYTPGREDVLSEYKRDKKNAPKKPLDHERIADITETESPNWDELLNNVTGLNTGTEQYTEYEHAIKELFDALFYPWLAHPETQTEINEGRKRIDITYTNAASDDFFAWVRDNYTAPYIMIECKNYSSDPANPELDQLASRFSTRRGRVGMLVCRSFDNKELFEQRCRDTADDGRGYIIAIDDNDLIELVNSVASEDNTERLSLLRNKFRKLVM